MKGIEGKGGTGGWSMADAGLKKRRGRGRLRRGGALLKPTPELEKKIM